MIESFRVGKLGSASPNRCSAAADWLTEKFFHLTLAWRAETRFYL